MKKMKNRFNLFALVLILGTFASTTFAQIEITDFKDDSSDAYYLNIELSIGEETFFESYKSELGLTENDEMQVKTSEIDELGFTHTRYKQYFKGIEVEGGTYILHSKESYVIIANGELIEGLNLNIVPSISESEALESALKEIAAVEYAWQSKEWEDGLKLETENEIATYYPIGTLVFTKDFLTSPKFENYLLAYRFEIVCSNPDENFMIYIDAEKGSFIKKYPLTKDCTNHVGSATMMYYGYHTFNVNKRGWPYNDYTLEDCTRGSGIKTKWAHFLPDNVTDDNGNWGTDDQKGTTIHWIAQRAWDYYQATHSRNGMDNSGHQLDMRADWNQANAVYSHILGNDKIKIGTFTNYLGTLDVVGHEFTHGITQYTANLEYENESGALNESFSDIFGTAIERYSLGSNDWDLGAPAITLRNMENPNAFSQPDFYEGAFWYTGPDDTGGVHTNSGVQNYWFYLLSSGATANVTGIGFDKAAKIAYRTLTIYLDETSDYNDARTWSLQSAADLYGSCSNEWLMTNNAWSEVGLGATLPFIFCATISGPSLICEEELNDIDYIFNASGTYNGLTNPTGMTFSWVITPSSPAWTFNLSGTGNKKMTVTNVNGTTDRTLTVTASFAGQTQTDAHNVLIEPCDDCPPLCKIGFFDKTDELSINIFPNPTDGIVNYYITNSTGEVLLQVFDIKGKLLFNKNISKSDGTLNISEFPSGIYLFKLADNSNSTSHLIQVNK